MCLSAPNPLLILSFSADFLAYALDQRKKMKMKMKKKETPLRCRRY